MAIEENVKRLKNKETLYMLHNPNTYKCLDLENAKRVYTFQKVFDDLEIKVTRQNISNTDNVALNNFH